MLRSMTKNIRFISTLGFSGFGIILSLNNGCYGFCFCPQKDSDEAPAYCAEHPWATQTQDGCSAYCEGFQTWYASSSPPHPKTSYFNSNNKSAAQAECTTWANAFNQANPGHW